MATIKPGHCRSGDQWDLAHNLHAITDKFGETNGIVSGNLSVVPLSVDSPQFGV